MHWSFGATEVDRRTTLIGTSLRSQGLDGEEATTKGFGPLLGLRVLILRLCINYARS